MITRLMQTLPLGVTGWLYNMRRVSRMLIPTLSYPLADQTGSLSCQPLIIVSSGRAGTTLLRSMLVMGGEIAMPPETETLPMMMMQYTALQELGWRNLTRTVISLMETSYNYELWDIELNSVYLRAKAIPKQEQSLARLIDTLYQYYGERHFPNAVLWGDQTPDNLMYYRWFLDVFPHAKYLHMIRDGRDVVASFSQLPRYDVDSGIERWRTSIENAEHLRQQLPSEQFFEMRYADLVTDTEATLKAVCSFAGISYTPLMLDYWRSDSTAEHKKYEHHQNLAQPVFTSSIGRWRERLSVEEQIRTQSALDDLLERFGYGD